jgi:hypothetical protein
MGEVGPHAFYQAASKSKIVKPKVMLNLAVTPLRIPKHARAKTDSRPDP